MAIVNMQKGNPLSMNLAIRDFCFMLPVAGAGNGLSAFLAKCCWEELNQVPVNGWPLGSFLRKTWQDKDLCGIVCYYERDGKYCYDKTSEIIRVKMALPFSSPEHLAFVMDGMAIPAGERFSIMQALARANLLIEVFDFSHG